MREFAVSVFRFRFHPTGVIPAFEPYLSVKNGWLLTLRSRGFVSDGFAGLCLREAMTSSVSFSPAPFDLRICSSSSDCLSFWSSDDSSSRLMVFASSSLSPSSKMPLLHMQDNRSCKIDCRRLMSFPIRWSTRFDLSVRAFRRLVSSVAWFRRRQSSVASALWFRWKEAAPRLDPCSLIAGRSSTWKVTCLSLLPRRFSFLWAEGHKLFILGLSVRPFSSLCWTAV